VKLEGKIDNSWRTNKNRKRKVQESQKIKFFMAQLTLKKLQKLLMKVQKPRTSMEKSAIHRMMNVWCCLFVHKLSSHESHKLNI
jgi:hypothetical protein